LYINEIIEELWTFWKITRTRNTFKHQVRTAQ
jgi:hypothetical protein